MGGAVGAAVRCTIRPMTRDQEATLGAWLIHAPGQSPAWDDYLLMLVHLRPIDGAQPAMKQFPEAEHQITLLALDRRGRPRAADPETWWPLWPLNGEVQFGGASDAEAQHALMLLALAICQGQLRAEAPHAGPGREAFKRYAQRLIANVVLPRPAL